MNNVISLLEDILGPGELHSKGNVQFQCPFCNHPKKKLSIRIEVGQWHCWVCNAGGRAYRSLLRLLKVSSAKQKLILSAVGQNISNNIYDEPLFALQLPEDYIPLWIKNDKSLYWKFAIEYLLKDRKLQLSDIVKYKIGYCQSGPYSGMLIFPNYDSNGILNYYTTRSFIKQATRKFLNPPTDRKEIIGFELQTNWAEPVIIVESALDAMTVRRNAAPLYGKRLYEKIKLHIIDFGTPEIIMCLDGDALKDSIEHIKYFLANGLSVKLCELKVGEDPNNLGYDKIWQKIDNSKEMNSAELFKMEMNFRL